MKRFELTRSRTSLWAWIAMIACLGMLAGCGGGGSDPGYPQVRGTVLLDGQPLTTGTVTFMPAEGGGNTASSEIGSNGSFRLGTHRPGDGCPPGRYQVAIIAWETPPTMEEPAGVRLIPEKYFSPATSGLTADVGEQGADNLTFELESGS